MKPASDALPRSPYRHVPMPGAVGAVDTSRVLRATQATFALAALVMVGATLPLADGLTALDAATASRGGAAVLLPTLLLASGAAILCARASWRREPPLRGERRGFTLVVATFLLAQLGLGAILARAGQGERLADVFPVALLPLAAVAAGAGWRREGWEGWAYALASFALATGGGMYTLVVVAAGRTAPPGSEAPLGVQVHLALAGSLLLVAGWAMVPLVKAHDLATYAGMGALAVAIDAGTMRGLASLQGVRIADRLMLGTDYAWWANYFTAEQLLALGAAALAVPSLVLAAQRRYAVAGLGVLGVAMLLAPR